VKRVTFLRQGGAVVEYQCISAIYGPDSRNVILRGAKRTDQMPTRAVQFVLIPLEGILSMTEEDW
jgi:hypothetical protein